MGGEGRCWREKEQKQTFNGEPLISMYWSKLREQEHLSSYVVGKKEIFSVHIVALLFLEVLLLLKH